MAPICTKPWTRLYVTVDGKCWNCCFQKHPFHIIEGDDSFESIWNNVNIQHIRRKLKDGEMPHFCDCLNKRGSVPPPDQDASVPFSSPVEIPPSLVQVSVKKKV